MAMEKSCSMNRFCGGLSAIACVSLFMLLFNGCKKEGTSLFDPNYAGRPDPVITALTPNSGLAGVSTFTITGANFSPIKEENTVLFDAVKAQVLTASSTQLTVRAPNIVKDSIKVKVSVFRAERFSNIVLCKLDAAVWELEGLKLGEEPWGTAIDAAGNIYVSIVSNGVGIGIKKFTPDATRSDFAPASGFTKWSSLRVGPNNVLYGALNLRAIFQIPPGTSPVLWVGPTSGIGTIYVFDFDAQGNIWAAGNNTAVYRVKQDKNIKSFPLNASIRSVRVYNGYVYFAGKTFPDSLEKIIRYQIISSDSLGPQEVYYNFSSSSYGAPDKSVYAITFSSQGDLFVGTDLADPILVVHPDKSAEPFYPGVLAPTLHILLWGKGTELLAVRGNASAGAVSNSLKILRINAQVTGAP